MISEYQKEKISKLPKERKDFIEKQISIHPDGMLKNDCFMPTDGYCYHCNADLIKYELEHKNDGSKLVTGCHKCHRSYCH